MPNSYFQFKQFTVHQDRCAMKVCTDACLFGAWMVDMIRQNGWKIDNALDIGTGTGLLSLMLAQEYGFYIDAIEINPVAALQAKENVSSSPWSDRISVFNTSLQDLSPGKKYDFIFSNPPFFENDLVSVDENKNAAKHDSSLTLDVLVDFMGKHLSESGYASVLIPYHRSTYFKLLLQKHGFAVLQEMQVRQSVKHDFFRTMIFFSNKAENATVLREMSIQDENRNYTDEFVAKLKAYYLKFQ